MTTLAFRTTVRFTALELRRSRWLPMLVAICLAGAGAGLFGGALGLTEQAAITVSLAAPLLRLLAVLLVASLVCTAVTREIADRTRQLALASSLSRPRWLLARALGFALVAWGTAAAATVTIAALSPAGGLIGVLAWGLSLALELTIVTALTVAIALALEQMTLAVLATALVYAASRLIGVILLLSARGPTAGAAGIDGPADALLQGLGALLPRLDLFARTDWLLGHAPEQIGAQLAQALLYPALALTVAAIDFGRKDA